ncbi:myelin and lymphocyte protein-like isoform X2 [Thunnus albacares]|uniref:myelin and lymphocyte protein-like isoform X2 n=1 Tax=Thunnus albacares TaxID=8236 RepID=UPI001CF635CB|nr:myelin and lymphocyte protein-like isoform X2 [Thunnus albacares]
MDNVPVVFGGLVWMLVASTYVEPENPLGWVMFVSVFCFVMTTLWFFIFLCGANQSKIWPSLDVGYHFVAAVFYLGASVPLAYITLIRGEAVKLIPSGVPLNPLMEDILKKYRLTIAAVVMSFLATLLYFLHTIFSAIRWRRS